MVNQHYCWDPAATEGTSPPKMYGRMVEPGLVDSTWHCASAHCFVSAALLLGGFHHLRKRASKNIWNNGRTRTCWFTVTMLVFTSSSVQQFWSPKICLWFHTLLIHLISFLNIFSCFWESNCSYKHTISSMSLTFRKNCWWFYVPFQKVSCSGASSSGKNAGCHE